VNVNGPINISSASSGAIRPVGTAVGTMVGAPVAVSTASSTTTVVPEGTTLELKKETASSVKQTVSNGQAVIKKTVVAQQVSVPVTTLREEYTVEEQNVDAAPTTPWGEGEKVFSLPLSKEVPNIVITPRVYKVLTIKKTTVTDQGAVTGTVRTENAEVAKQQP